MLKFPLHCLNRPGLQVKWQVFEDVWSTVAMSIDSIRFQQYRIWEECESDIAQDTLTMFQRCFTLKETTSWSKWTTPRKAERRIRCRIKRFCLRGRLSINWRAMTWELRHRPANTTFPAFRVSVPAFFILWQLSNNDQMQPGLCKIVCCEKIRRLQKSLAKNKRCGAVGQKPHYFPIPVLLKQNQKLPKRLGVGRAWMRTHRTPYTATQVAAARGNMIWQQLPNKSVSVGCWNISIPAKLFCFEKKQDDFRKVLLKIKGAVDQRPLYFATLVLLFSFAWMRTHRTLLQQR